jgi:hypothetical protein
MKRMKRPVVSGPNKGYLVSFGDTMTALLAFFIVLNSLAEDQTGAKLYAGTGSFAVAISGFGMTNRQSSKRASVVVQKQATSPIYGIAEVDDSENVPSLDLERNRQRVIDQEREQWERFLNEIDHRYGVQPLPRIQSQVAFDVFDRIPARRPRLSDTERMAFSDLLPLLRHDNYRVAVVVWATTPNQSAWERAMHQAKEIRTELVELGQLRPDEQQRLVAMARPWHDADKKRPSMSLLVLKLERG